MDITNLRSKLEELGGYDYEIAEREERMEGNPTVDITMSKGFQARLASRALKVPVAQIKGLKLDEYVYLTGEVFNFLMKHSVEVAKARLVESEKLQSV